MKRNSPDQQSVSTAESDEKIPGPPDNSFWQRYSPHQELPLSLSSSGVVHAVLIALLLLGGIMTARWHERPDISIGIVVGDDGGRPDAGAAQRGSGPEEALPQEPTGQLKAEPVKPLPLTSDNVVLPPLVKPQDERPFDQGLKTRLDEVRRGASDKLRRGPPVAGPGDDDGPPGHGLGRSGGKLNVRQHRLLRWTMVFNIRQPEDYARQLQDLKAILAIPITGKDNQFLLIEDLAKRPVEPRPRDVSQINRIYWVDDDAKSVSSLARVLGVEPAPPYFVAFFPEELEKKLLQKELAYARGKTEDMIQETRFQIRSTAKGYEPFVIDQKYREPSKK
jgi:hypothetical protein